MDTPTPAELIRDELSEAFNRAVANYYACVDMQDWSGAFEARVLIEHIHELEEQLAV